MRAILDRVSENRTLGRRAERIFRAKLKWGETQQIFAGGLRRSSRLNECARCFSAVFKASLRQPTARNQVDAIPSRIAARQATKVCARITMQKRFRKSKLGSCKRNSRSVHVREHYHRAGAFANFLSRGFVFPGPAQTSRTNSLPSFPPASEKMSTADYLTAPHTSSAAQRVDLRAADGAAEWDDRQRHCVSIIRQSATAQVRAQNLARSRTARAGFPRRLAVTGLLAKTHPFSRIEIRAAPLAKNQIGEE